jgi:hypothetical protein
LGFIVFAMKAMQLILFILFFSGIEQSNLLAQEAISSSGDDASGNTGTVSFTIGQVFYSGNTGSTGSILQGVQLPVEITWLGLDDNFLDKIHCKTYPNPTSEYLILEVERLPLINLEFEFYDDNGRLILRDQISGNKTLIKMKNLAPSIYMLRVTNHEKTLTTFKIIKN